MHTQILAALSPSYVCSIHIEAKMVQLKSVANYDVLFFHGCGIYDKKYDLNYFH